MFLVFMVFVICCVVRLLNCCTWQLYCHLPHQAGCNHGGGAESIFSDLNGNARQMWSSLADDFSSLFMTVSGKLIVFNSCER